MQKQLFKILTIAITMIFMTLSAEAANNYLNSVVLQGTENGHNIVLRSDYQAKIKKTIQSSDKITLTIKGIEAASNLSTLYKDTTAIHNLVVENSGNNELKIYVQAPDISKANVVFETPAAAPVSMNSNEAFKKVLWVMLSLAMLIIVVKSTKTLNKYEKPKDLTRSIRDREVEMYKNFKREMALTPSITSSITPNINYKIKNSQRSQSYTTNTIRKGETIRNYEHLMRLN